VLVCLDKQDFQKAGLSQQIDERIVKDSLLFKPELGAPLQTYFRFLEKKLGKEDQAKVVERLWALYRDSKQSNYSLEQRA